MSVPRIAKELHETPQRDADSRRRLRIQRNASRSNVVVGVLIAALCFSGAPGCRLVERGGPVPESLADCRQLTRGGISAMERGEWDVADRLLSEAISTCPVDPEARRNYAEILWQRNARDEALAQIDEALQLASDDVSLLVRGSEMRLDVSDVERALDGVEQALDLDPKYPPAWALRGRIMQQQGQPRRALADYHRALGYEPNQQDVLLLAAELYRELGQPRPALVNLQTLADTFPPGEEPGRVLYLQGLVYSALARFEEAADAYATALDRSGPNPELLFRLAQAQWLAGRASDARLAAQKALSIAPGHAATLALLDRMARGGPGRQWR